MATGKSTWKKWLQPSRLIPTLTVFTAGIAVLLSLLGLFQPSIAEGIIIALLMLIAVDALSERINILEKIETQLEWLRDWFSARRTSNFEKRLLDVFLPFSVIAADMDKKHGVMQIEYHLYKVDPHKRPHIVLKREDNSSWYSLYKDQIEKA